MKADIIEIDNTFVPITHSRVREMIDALENRLIAAAREVRTVEMKASVGDGKLVITLKIGDPIR
jgi:hypothetical protein